MSSHSPWGGRLPPVAGSLTWPRWLCGRLGEGGGWVPCECECCIALLHVCRGCRRSFGSSRALVLVHRMHRSPRSLGRCACTPQRSDSKHLAYGEPYDAMHNCSEHFMPHLPAACACWPSTSNQSCWGLQLVKPSPRQRLQIALVDPRMDASSTHAFSLALQVAPQACVQRVCLERSMCPASAAEANPRAR